MAELFASGRIIDLILVFMAIEAMLLLAYTRHARGVWAFGDVGSLLMPGLFLMLALRAALDHDDWVWIAAYLSASLVAHLIDVMRRMR